MMLGLLAASLTFTATATGVEKGTPLEFVFAGRNSDRDYESMFLIDGTVDEFCSRLEHAGLPRGMPTEQDACRLWPVGCSLRFDPPLSEFVHGKMPDGLPEANVIYTGGTRLPDGACDAGTNMPASVFSIYTLSQSPLVFDGIYDQGSVYGHFTAGKQLKKGDRMKFTVSWDPKTLPKAIHLTVRPGNSLEVLRRLRTESESCDVSALIGFDDHLTISEATAAANALATIDSPHIKINGFTNVFYRTFLPLVKWRDRSERLTQPFELTLGPPEKLLFIEEDWTVEGSDPKLTPREISYADVVKYPQTDTCFIYAHSDVPISRILESMNKLKIGNIRNWYVFSSE